MPGESIAYLTQSVNPAAVTVAGLALGAVSTVLAAVTVQDVTVWVTGLGSAGALAFGGGLYWYQRANRIRREEYRAWEETRKETLTPQIEKLMEQLRENKETVDKLRASVHDARAEANRYALEGQELRQDLQNMNSQYFNLTQQLTQANATIATLNGTIRELNGMLRAENAENVRLRLEVITLSHSVVELKGAITRPPAAPAPGPPVAGG